VLSYLCEIGNKLRIIINVAENHGSLPQHYGCQSCARRLPLAQET
jgi:hypothetical protein